MILTQFRRAASRRWIQCLAPLAALLGLSASGVEFPGTSPGPAQGSISNGTFVLENRAFQFTWLSSAGRLQPLAFSNKLAGHFWAQTGSELFRLGDNANNSTDFNLPSSAFVLIEGPRLQASQILTNSSRMGDRTPGQELVARLRHPCGVEVVWRAVLRDDANYLRQFITFSSTNSAETITGVQMLDWAVTNTPTRVGTVGGSPGMAGQAFFGGESPFAIPGIGVDRAQFSLPCQLRLGAGVAYEFSSVVGVYPQGQLRRSFLYYVERERAQPYRQFLHYNSWFDSLTNINEQQMAQSIALCETELRQKRGIGLESYALDDGWDDSTLGFWAINTNAFPNRFDRLTEMVRSNGTHMGIWISPMGGYSSRRLVRIQAGVAEGLFPSEPDLSLPTYYNWWVDRCRGFLRSNEVNYFKWDAAGLGVTPHFMAVLRAADEVRADSTNLFLNVTAGTWPSPFWLIHADSTWRGGEDTGFMGLGSARECWITYRDSMTYQNVVQGAPLYPLTALMIHGIICGYWHLPEWGPDFRHEARTFFGSGIALQELYITPQMLNSNSWDHVAASARWAASNATVLADSHWIGGNPKSLQTYGWASWTAQKGILVLRNPSNQVQSILVDAATAFELPPGAPTVYDLTPVYSDQRSVLPVLQAGLPIPVSMQPFEVLVWDAHPRSTYSQQIQALAPIAYWRLGDTNGSTARDAAGTNDGLYVNAVPHTLPGALLQEDDGGVQLAGSGSHVVIANRARFAFSGTAPFTLTAWVDLSQLSGCPRLFSNRSTPTTGGNAGYSLGIAGGTNLVFTAFGRSEGIAPIPVARPGQWSHVAAVRRGQTVELYWNGLPVGTNFLPDILASSSPLQLGGHPATDLGEEPWCGQLDEAAVFDRALEPASIQALYAGQVGSVIAPFLLSQPGPLVCYPGSTATLAVAAIASPPPAYSWQLDGIDIPGATNASLVLTNITLETQGTYSVRVTNVAGCTSSAPVLLAVRVPAAYATAILADRPVAYWRLNENGGGAICDVTGEYSGQVAGGVLYSQPGALTGDTDPSLYFDGSPGTKIDVPYCANLNPPRFTIECWTKVLGGAGTFRSPLTSRADSPFSGYMFYAGYDNRWVFMTGRVPSPWLVQFGPAVVEGQWTFLAGTCDGTNVSFYVNGQLVDRAASTFVPNVSRPLRIGAGMTETAGDFFLRGWVDEVALYDRALSENEIQKHYANLSTPPTLWVKRLNPGLRLSWPGGELQQADSVTGPWTSLTNALSPWFVSPSASQFYRIHIP